MVQIKVAASPVKSVLAALRAEDYELRCDCGGGGSCGRCKARLVDGVLSPATEAEKRLLTAEELTAGWFLMCCREAVSACLIEIADLSGVNLYGTCLKPEAGSRLALALDLGTTTLASALVELPSGRILARASRSNPQSSYGSDVLGRLAATLQNPQSAAVLQRLILRGVDEMTQALCSAAGREAKEIEMMVAAGNTIMSYLFFGLDVASLAHVPFSLPEEALPVLKGGDLGLTAASSALVQPLPCIAGYVGGDTMALILAQELWRAQGRHLAVDIGTNGELVLAVDGRLYVASTAAGPAFEGANISCGMRALPGAIYQVIYQNSSLNCRTINEESPRGLCGTGLLSAVAALLKAGVITGQGKIRPAAELRPDLAARRTEGPGGGFWLSDTVLLTQRDVRQLQLAKAAMSAGIRLILQTAGVAMSEVDEVILAGAFGASIVVEEAMAIGLMPPELRGARFTLAVDAVLSGAAKCAVSGELWQQSKEIAVAAEHVELSGAADFTSAFIKAMPF